VMKYLKTVINDEELEALINSNSPQIYQQFARRLNINEETVSLHLHAIGKIRCLKLMFKKRKKNCLGT